LSAIGFISDLHLAEEQPARIELFLRFLEKHTPTLEHLYILGDLFELWLGDDLIPASLQPVINGLKQASLTLPITIIHGNRDFLLGARFEQLSGCKIVAEPLIIELAIGPVMLLHGDLLCTDDHDYQQMRLQLRSSQWIDSFLNKPALERSAIAHDLRQQSRVATQDKHSEIMDTNEHEVIHYLEHFGVAAMIHGHIHRTAIYDHRLSSGKIVKRYVLDEWHDECGQLLLADSNGLHFENFTARAY
jgi:UDP-2,3-diacylglucosamine hydrolase